MRIHVADIPHPNIDAQSVVLSSTVICVLIDNQ